MNDAYQAVYDVWKQEVCFAAAQHAAPAAVYRPALSIDGNQWCALYGENIQDGVAGFGESPALAMEDFNKAWVTKLAKDSTHD